jgi:hypothetical protein
MIENIKTHLKEYFENETLDRENGYPERNADWMKENLLPRIKNNITNLEEKIVWMSDVHLVILLVC